MPAIYQPSLVTRLPLCSVMTQAQGEKEGISACSFFIYSTAVMACGFCTVEGSQIFCKYSTLGEQYSFFSLGFKSLKILVIQ